MNWENLGEDYMGYEFEFISPLPKDLECPICRRAMRNPRQMCPCGHQCCEFCFVQSQRSDDSLICPVDRNSLSEDEGQQRKNMQEVPAWLCSTFQTILKRKIESLEVKCLQCNRGCEWVGEIRNYNNHSEVCVYQNETCEDCSMEMERMCFQDHKLLHCPERIVSCEYCQEDVIFSDLKEHNEQCQQYPLECPQSCGIQNLPRNETESHVKNDCVNTVVSCPYSEVGCTFKDMRCKLEVHKEDHLRRIPQQLADLQREMKSGLAELGCLVESLQLQLDQAEKKIVQLENNTAQMDLRFSITESRVDVESVNETTKALERGLAQSQRKNAELEKEIAQLKLTTAQLRQSVSLNTRDRKRKGSKASSRRRKRKPTLTFVGCSDEDEIESDHLCPTGEESNTL